MRWSPSASASNLLVESVDAADLLILQHGSKLHAVTSDMVTLVAQPSMDGNRRLFSVEWKPSDATVLVGADHGEAVIREATDRLLFATSAQLVGLSRAMLQLAVEHVKVREQFGRPLGTLQAVQHRLADVAVAIEMTAPVVARSGCSLAAGAPSAERDTAMAKVFASDMGEKAAYAALQVHGAIGYTQEHDLHLYMMRALCLAQAYGDARYHRNRVADLLLSNETAPRNPA
jgi:alkylation response protein AidB-like acyl-CoA dehydrogenase